MGASFCYQGPHFPNPLNNPDDIKSLRYPVDVSKELNYVFSAISLTRHRLEGKVPLIGFCGAPVSLNDSNNHYVVVNTLQWTLMSYIIAGGGSPTLSKAKLWLYQHQETSHELLQIITDVCVDFLVGQVRAGAQVIQYLSQILC